MATNRFNDIKYTYEAIEKNLRQLESQDERVDQQRMLVPQILSKFPTEVLVKLEESKKPDENWTVKLLRGSLKRCIDVHENAQRHEFNSRGPIYRGQRSGNSSNQSNQRPIPFVENQGNRPVEAFMVDSTRNNERQNSQIHKRRLAFPCVFCRGAHFNDGCDKFTSVTDRKHQLTSQGRCFVCLKIGHFFKECPTTPCHYCKRVGHHNRSLCPKQFIETPQSSETTATN